MGNERLPVDRRRQAPAAPSSTPGPAAAGSSPLCGPIPVAGLVHRDLDAERTVPVAGPVDVIAVLQAGAPAGVRGAAARMTAQSRPAAPPVIRRALKVAAVKSTAGVRWTLSGRPPFSKKTNTTLPVESGNHRAHTTSWETIRTTTESYLNGTVEFFELEAQIMGLFYGGPDWDEMDAELAKMAKRDTVGETVVRRFLTLANQSLDNLDEGNGPVNSSIGGNFDPKVEQTAGGLFDLTEQAREAAIYTAHLIKPLKLDASGQNIVASTAPGGLIPVSQTTGTLKEMIDGEWYEKASGSNDTTAASTGKAPSPSKRKKEDRKRAKAPY